MSGALCIFWIFLIHLIQIAHKIAHTEYIKTQKNICIELYMCIINNDGSGTRRSTTSDKNAIIHCIDIALMTFTSPRIQNASLMIEPMIAQKENVYSYKFGVLLVRGWITMTRTVYKLWLFDLSGFSFCRFV